MDRWICQLTSQEYMLIECLLKKARRVNITLCADSIRPDASEDELDVFRRSNTPAKAQYCKSQ